jgi:hypothetical protein
MKHKIQKVELFFGVIILLGGLLTYGLGVHQLLPVPRPGFGCLWYNTYWDNFDFNGV